MRGARGREVLKTVMESILSATKPNAGPWMARSRTRPISTFAMRSRSDGSDFSCHPLEQLGRSEIWSNGDLAHWIAEVEAQEGFREVTDRASVESRVEQEHV